MNTHDLGILGGNAVKKKYGVEHYRRMNQISQKSRFGKMTKEEKSEYFKRIRRGEKVSQPRQNVKQTLNS